GYTATKVSLVTSLCSLVGIFAPTFWGILSDKRRTIKWILLICFIGSACLYPLIPRAAAITLAVFQWELPLVLLLAPLDNFFRMPARQLVENYVVRESNQKHLNYGVIRACGSLAYGVTGMILGQILDKIGGARTTFWLYGISVIPVILLCLTIRDSETFTSSSRKKLSFREMQFGSLFKNYYYVVYLLYSVILFLPISSSQTFLSYYLADRGISTTVYATIAGLRAAAEVPMMLLFRRLRRHLPLQTMLIISAFVYGAESILLFFLTSKLPIITVCAIHGLAGGMKIAAAANYIYLLAPDHLKATAQTLNGAASSVAGIIAPLIGGILVDRIGAGKYFLICGFIILGAGLLFALSFPFGKKVLHKKAPGIVE
ncbi:MAG: MFS transporter, partial [Clostridia bacterium]|nr:MFS transporter [Clostridia bacterium]